MNRIKNIRVGIIAVAFALAASVFGQLYINKQTFAANTLSGNNEIITIGGTTDGQPVNAAFSVKAYSGDGNVLLFSSNATNLPSAGTPGGLYAYNIRTNTTTRVDLSTSGALPNGSLFGGAGGQGFKLSETGRYVIFGSSATNLIDDTTTPAKLLYKRDMQTGTTSKVGGFSTGYSDKWDSYLGVSNDGRFVLMSSRYVANGYPNDYGYALGDGATGTYNWTSLGKDSSSEDAGVGGISCDGSFAVFRKSDDIYLTDLRNGNTTAVAAGNYSNISPLISCNGRYILYATKNRTYITPTPSGMDSYYHLVRYDRITGERKYIDSNSSDVFSTDHLSYTSSWADQQPNIFNASVADTGDVVLKYNGNTYLKHLSDGSGTLESIAKHSSGAYINVSNGTITGDGRYVFFMTDPYSLGLAPSPSSSQLIRAKTNL